MATCSIWIGVREIVGVRVVESTCFLELILEGLLLNVIKALNKFAQVLDYASSKSEDQSVPSAGQADTMPAEGEKNTNQATISQLFQRRAEKNAEKENLNSQKPKPILPIITTTTQMQSPLQKEAEKESTNSDSNDDDETHVTGSMVEPSTTKKLKKFDFITEDGRHIHLNEKEINRQKKLEEDAKAEAAKQEGEVRKAELVDLLGPEVGPNTLKVYREDGTSEVIPIFKTIDLHLGEWREVVKACPNRTGKGWKTIYGQIQTRMDYFDPLDKLNDLANKKRKHADDIHNYFKANKMLKQDFVTIEDLKDFPNTMLYSVQEIFFRHHQGPELNDHARTFSSLLLAEVDKRNLNPLKQMRVIFSWIWIDVSKEVEWKPFIITLSFVNVIGTETEEGLWKELQFSLVDNSKLNVVCLLNREFKFEGDNTPIFIQPPCYSASKESGLRFWFHIKRFYNSGFGFVLQVSYSRFRNTGLILQVSYSKFHIQRFFITRFVSRSFRIQRFRNTVVKVSDIGLSYQVKFALYSLNFSNMSIANQQTLAESGAENRPQILEKGSYVPWANIKVMNYILQGIPNDIYNSVDACKDAQTMWSMIKRLIRGFQHSSTSWIGINLLPKKYPLTPNSLTHCNLSGANMSPWLVKKYVLEKEHFDVLYDYMSQFEPHVKASKAKKDAMNHDPLALVANSHDHSLYSHASSSYSRSPQPYYVTHPSSVIDNDDDYQGEIQRDAQEDNLSTAMMLLLRVITQHYSTPTNNRLRTSSNTRNQAAIQDGRVDIQSKNVRYARNGNRNAGRTNRNQATNAVNGKTNVQYYNCNGRGHYARDCPKPRVRDAKYFREHMLLATKDEAGVHLDEEENDFMLDNAYEDNALQELNAAVIMMAHIQPTDDKSDAEPTYDVELISEVNASQIDMIIGLFSKSDHEDRHHEKLETIIHTTADDQIDSGIIFNDPYVDNNSGQAEHDANSHYQPFPDFESLINNVQVETENQRKLNIELQKQKALLQRELETFKKDFKAREGKYLEDIVTLEEKLKSHDQIVYKISHSLQIIHMLGKKPKLFYDPHIKTGLGYQNPEHLKKAIAAQPKIYNGNSLNNKKEKINLTDYEETLEDAEKSRLKMKDKIIPLDYPKLNVLYESFVSQMEILAEQTYFSSPSISNVSPESSSKKSNLPPKKMPNESQLLKLFVNLDNEIKELGKLINIHHKMDKDRSFIYDNKVDIRRIFTLESIERKVEDQSQKDELFQKEIDRLLEASLERKVRDCVLISVEQQKNEISVMLVSPNSRVKRALFTSHVAAKSSQAGATLVVAKSRFSVATPPKATNKVSRASSLTPESRQNRTLRTYMNNKIKMSRKWQKLFENQSSFNWSPKSPNAQTPPSVTKSSTSARTHSRTLVTKQQWVAKLSTLSSVFVACDAGDSARPLDC
ncbi:integrase, catalytic region, zinc finger, CCHC-type containing protein [Tanacetum coccineum]